MIVPAHWAEGRIQQQVGGRQVTVRRFGWSDDSAAAAQVHADARTREAFERIAAGDDKIERRERKVPYDGADGMPIREEIVERHGDNIVTRNSYGARCLNTPDVLFADIDFDAAPARGGLATVIVAALLGAGAAGYAARSAIAGAVAFVAVLAIGFWRLRRERQPATPAGNGNGNGIEQAVGARLERFIAQHPEWHLRLYRTPAGFRVLAMHDVFRPDAAAVSDLFQTLGADKVYGRMCRNQNCFRARLSAKPWRIGIVEPLRPRPGVWPIDPARQPAREAWVARYEEAAAGHAACRFLLSVGKVERVHPRAKAVQELHDERTRALSDLPLA